MRSGMILNFFKSVQNIRSAMNPATRVICDGPKFTGDGLKTSEKDSNKNIRIENNTVKQIPALRSIRTSDCVVSGRKIGIEKNVSRLIPTPGNTRAASFVEDNPFLAFVYYFEDEALKRITLSGTEFYDLIDKVHKYRFKDIESKIECLRRILQATVLKDEFVISCLNVRRSDVSKTLFLELFIVLINMHGCTVRFEEEMMITVPGNSQNLQALESIHHPEFMFPRTVVFCKNTVNGFTTTLDNHIGAGPLLFFLNHLNFTNFDVFGE